MVRRRRDKSSTRRLTCSRNRARGSVLALLSASSGLASATGKSGIMIDRSARPSIVTAFLGATGFVPRQQQRQQQQQQQQLQQRGQQRQQRQQALHSKRVRAWHQAHGGDRSAQSSRIHDPRRKRTLPIRPLPSSAAASLLPSPPLTADEDGVDKASSGSSSSSSSKLTIAAEGRLSPKLPTRQGTTTADMPAVRHGQLRQHGRGLLPVQQRPRHEGRRGLSAMHDEERDRQHRSASHRGSNGGGGGGGGGRPGTNNLPSVSGPAAATTATTAAPSANSTDTAVSSPASSYQSPPVSPQKLPDHLEYLLGRGDWKKAVVTFQKCRKHEAATRGAASATAVKKNSRTLLSLGAYNQALMAYAQGRDGRSALELLREMRNAGGRLTPSRGSFNACLDACRYGGQRNKVMSVLEMMVDDGVPPSGKSYSSALQACAKDGNVADARKMLGWMWTSPDLEGGIKGLRPTTWGYNCAMEACARSGDWASALELMVEMNSNGLSHDAFTYGAALEACGRTGNWQKAEAVVTQMADAYAASLAELLQTASTRGGGENGAVADPRKSTLTPTTVHCNALLQSYSRGKRVDKAVRMLEHMLMITPSGTPADTKTNTSATDAKGDVGSTDEDGGGGDREHGESDEDEVVLRWDPRLPLSRPDAISFGTVIDGCSRARMADKAVELLKIMREERIEEASVGQAGSRGGLRGADSGDVGGGGPPTLPPNVHSVTAAITACGRAGRIEQAIAVLREAVLLENAWLDQQTQPLRPLVRQEDGAQEGSPSAAAMAVMAAAALGHQHQHQQHGRSGEGRQVVDETSAPILKGPEEKKENDAAVPVAVAEAGGASAVSERFSAKAAGEGDKNEREAAGVNDGSRASAPFPAAASSPATVAAPRRATSGTSTSTSTATVTAEATPRAALGVRSRVPRGATNVPDGSGGRASSVALQPAYNAAINACVEAGRSADARSLIKDMRERGLRPGRECFNSLLVACSSSHEALDILAEMERALVAPDVASYTAAIGACSRGSDLPAALALFETMQRPPSAAPTKPATAGIAFSTAVDPKNSGDRTTVRHRGVRGPPRADAQAYGAAAAACARGLDHKAAVRLLTEMRQAGLRPGRPMFGAVIDACARRGKWEEAIKLLEEMTESGVAPALPHYSSAIFACSLGGNPTKGLELLSSMRKKRVRANSTCVNAAIHGFALLGDWKMALEILGAMEKAFQVVPDSVSYNTAMKACFRAGETHKGLTLFDRMRSYPPAPPRGLGGPGGLGGGSDLGNASAAKRKPREQFPKFQVLFPGNDEEEASATGTSDASDPEFATAVERSDKGFRLGGTGAAREEISAARIRTASAGVRVISEAAREKERGARGFRASSPPRPDTVSYNTVIAAVASAWGHEGRGQAMALLSEMRTRGLRPDTYTVLAVEKAGGEVD